MWFDDDPDDRESGDGGLAFGVILAAVPLLLALMFGLPAIFLGR